MIKIFDTHLGKKVDFVPLEEGKVGFYLCGPTVYDLAHLGHGRSAVAFDVIRRYFEYRDFDVNFVSNYTDIDDKMIKRADEDDVSVAELATRIIKEYEQDYSALGVKPPNIQPKATEHIEGMVDLIEVLEKNGHTYELEDGVYFDVSTYADYGKFSGQDLDALQMGARVAVNDDKRNPQDFALWKLAKDEEPYEDYWDSPWGLGRPGWHIECSAMSRAHLGDTFDIHGGGLDLKFPHHECEVAQSRGALGDGTFAKHWMHNGFIQIDNEKMSKSLNNFFTLRDIFRKYDPVVVRYMFLQTHYRNPINFSDALLENAKAGLARIHDFVSRVKSLEGAVSYDSSGSFDEFEASMDNDFDTSGALGALFNFIKAANSALDSGESISPESILDFLGKIDAVLGVIFVEEDEIPAKITALAEKRKEARESKDFGASDSLRDEIKALGYLIEDSAQGYSLKKL